MLTELCGDRLIERELQLGIQHCLTYRCIGMFSVFAWGLSACNSPTDGSLNAVIEIGYENVSQARFGHQTDKANTPAAKISNKRGESNIDWMQILFRHFFVKFVIF